MTDHGRRDPTAVGAGFGAWLRDRRRAGTEVTGISAATTGFSSETYLVDVQDDGQEGRLVLKLPPSGSGIFSTYDFVTEARVQAAVSAAGVPAPVPAEVEQDPRWLGGPFLVMPAIAGRIIDEMPVRDPWLRAATPAQNAAVHGHYVDVIADVNRLDWGAAGLGDVVARRDGAAEIAYWREYLAWYGDGATLVPLLDESLDWCEANLPAAEPEPSLLWGDVRLGNVIFDDAGVPVAVLDWEMASIGAAEHDLAWTLTLQSTQDELVRRTVPGFLDEAGVIARYEQRLGRPLQDLPWYEILAMVRSSAIMVRIGHLQERAGVPVLFPLADNPVLGILRRKLGDAS